MSAAMPFSSCPPRSESGARIGVVAAISACTASVQKTTLTGPPASRKFGALISSRTSPTYFSCSNCFIAKQYLAELGAGQTETKNAYEIQFYYAECLYNSFQFLEAGKTALTAGRSGPTSREAQLEAEVDDLTRALGEAAVELRVWKKSAEGRLGPSRTSR